MADNRGKIKDYANYSKQANVSKREAQSGGLFSRVEGRQGWALGKSSVKSLFDLYANE